MIKLAATNSELFCRTFFPKAFRDASPSYSGKVWGALEDPRHRFVNLKIFRGGFKTTLLRAYTAKRIAYGLSRTILYVGASESHAVRSTMWLRGYIEPRMQGDGRMLPSLYAQTFDLRPGKKWQEHEFEIFHGVDAKPIWVLGVGITGNIRGINFDDYRPDTIVLDDPLTDENVATEEQRNKVCDLIMGALKNSLTPATEEPNAKLAMLVTPLHSDDVGARAQKSPEWHTEEFGCWTEETKDLPLERQVSIWPSRYPTETLRKEKLAAIADNRLSIFSREMEVKLVAAEQLSFRPNWLRYYDQPPRAATAVLVIDPVPPPSDRQLSKANLAGKDFEAQAVVGRWKGEYFLLDYRINRGHNPNWSAAMMFELGHKWRIMRIVLETIAAQRYLKWFLQQEMARKGVYFPIKDSPGDQRPKFVRITTALAGPASQGKFWCSKNHIEFIEQFQSYGIGYRGHEDLLETVAGGVRELTNPYMELGADEYEEIDNSSIPKFKVIRACP